MRLADWVTGSANAARVATLCAVAVAVSGCALPIGAEMDQASRIARYAVHFDHVAGPETNLLDRALAECSDKTVTAETACVRAGLEAAHLSSRSLAALVPQCRPGKVCHYDHTTHDRIGPVEATATDHVRHWRIDLDFRRPASDAAHVPVTVIDRDDFDTPQPG